MTAKINKAKWTHGQQAISFSLLPVDIDQGP